MKDDSPQPSPRAMNLVVELTDGEISAAEREELRALLAEEPASLEFYLEWMALHSMLHFDLSAGTPLATPRLARPHVPAEGEPLEERLDEEDWIDPESIASLLEEDMALSAQRAREAKEASRRESELSARQKELYLDRSLLRPTPASTSRAWYALATAAAVLLMAVAWQALSPPQLAPPAPGRPAERIVAAGPPAIGVVSQSFEATWRGTAAAFMLGAKLAPGPISLEQGVAEVTLLNGVRLVLEAPATLNLASTNQVVLEQGRVVAKVPPEGVGFTLRAQSAAFVDLGTEFGAEVTAEGASSVHVLQGEVALVRGKHFRDEPSRTLQAGEAHRVSPDGSTVSKIVFDATRFLRRVPRSPYELAVLKSRPLAAWALDHESAPLTSDGRLALATSTGFGVDVVDVRDAGVAVKSAGDPLRAARFQGDHDGLLVSADEALGMASECTYEAHVLATAIGSGPQRIFSTFDRPRSGLALGVVGGQWNQQPEGGLKAILTVYGDYDCVSASPIALGAWVHLAATIDDAGAPTLYVNGEPVARRFRTIASTAVAPEAIVGSVWQDEAPTPIGRRTGGEARIGRNPPGSDGQISPERWQGMISHVAVYGRALGVEEIQQHVAALREEEAAVN